LKDLKLKLLILRKKLLKRNRRLRLVSAAKLIFKNYLFCIFYLLK
jgi:hypothetical protein